MPDLPKPTLRRLLDAAAQVGADRLAMVRSSTPCRESGLFVLMIGAKAVRDLGPICIEAAAKVTDEHGLPVHKGDLQPDDNLDEWFDKMVAEKTYFAWGKKDDPYVMFTFFVGQELVDYLAPRLTEQGCWCEGGGPPKRY